MARNSSAVKLAIIALVMGVSGAAMAASYDLKAQWKTTANPNGVWSLVQGSTKLPRDADWTPLSTTDSAYTVGTRHIKQPALATGNSAGAFLPSFFKAAVTPAESDLGWLKGDLLVHTTDTFNGAAFGPASAIFTAPVATTADISGYVYNGRNINRPQAWQLSAGGVVKASGSLPGDGSITRATRHAFSVANVVLPAGGTVTLTITEAGGASGAGDFVGFDLKVVTH